MVKPTISLPEAWERLEPLLHKLFVERFKDISIPDWMNYITFASSPHKRPINLSFRIVGQYCTVSPASNSYNVLRGTDGDIFPR